MTYRRQRVEHFIRQELSELLRCQVKDPRIKGLITVTRVSASADLREAKVSISIMGTEEEKEETIQGLNSASGFLQFELGKRIRLRHTPQISFERDNSIEQGSRVVNLIEQLSAEL
jgi:ribosome-binding factor A